MNVRVGDRSCEFCDGAVSRREFLRVTAAAGLAAGVAGSAAPKLLAAPSPTSPAETLVKSLYETLSPMQREILCFDWDHVDAERGLLRTRISNNWHITQPTINSEFYTADQQQMLRKIFESVIQPEWHAKIDKQLQDDAGGFGRSQNIAIFGKPGDGKFELVMTGRHMTLRCDGNSTDHVAFGGPIFYGHAASGFNEKPGHPGNVFWEQALAANKVYEMLDGKQRKTAEVAQHPVEQEVGFRGTSGMRPGIPISELSSDQKEECQRVLQKLLEPYRQDDRDEVLACLTKQGGLDACNLAFYTADDLGEDKVWDSWRLEGPSFVWYFRGTPHVHVWVNIADNHEVQLNA